MCPLFVLRHNDPTDQIYLCTLRRHHQFVESLQFGDEIHVYARFGDAQWASIVIEKGSTIMVPSVIASSLSYYCDYCYKEILIQRWSCSMCGGFDRCDKCYEMRFNYQEYKGHVNSHPMFSYLV
ncbi:unnamed protein product [Sphagnum troendelagicum]|uniref:ZZ-type domain-containing protein n=1 Tax=Sphagnum troendelagicum TaxID=128251 RepID=A0ABP0TM35_9BRYO